MTFDSFPAFIEPNKLTKGKMVQVAGFPAENCKVTYMYEHTGPIEKVEPKSNGGCIIYYHVDMTPGNSGSRISLINEDLVKSNQRYDELSRKYESAGKPHDIRKMTIGVATGTDWGKKLNFGMLITPEINAWM